MQKDMKIKEFIQNNPFRCMGVATSDSSAILSSNSNRLKAYSSIGKSVTLPMDLDIVFGSAPDRSKSSLNSCIASLSVPAERLHYGLFWFMNTTDTDAKALDVIRRTGNLIEARRIWAIGRQGMSALQNQLVCCLLMDSRSYSKAIQFASSLYSRYGAEFIRTISNGFDVVAPDRLMPLFFEKIINCAGDDCQNFDKAVKRSAITGVEDIWTDVNATFLVNKIQQALNVAQSSECLTTKAHYHVAHELMKQTKSDLKALKTLSESHPVLLSRYSTIAETVGEFVLDNDIECYNNSSWSIGLDNNSLKLVRFCYRHASTIRFKKRCRICLNIILDRKEDAPLFPNGTPDDLSESDGKKRNAMISAIISGLKDAKGQ